jgi:hypothetical protein
VFLAFAALIAYFAIGAAIALIAYRGMRERKQSLSARVAVVSVIAFIVWVIPYGDHTWGKIHFKWLCGQDAGVRVFRTAMDVEGFRSLSGSANTPLQLGYKFFEKINSDGTITRYEVQDNGQVAERRAVIPLSRYLINRKEMNLSVQIIRIEDVIVDLKTNERLAESVEYGHRGGWLVRQFGAMHAYRLTCPSEPVNFGKVMREVLRANSGRT